MKIKICGIREKGDVQAIAAMGPDYMGFIFYSGSPRCMTGSLTPDDLVSVPETIRKTGVFVNEQADVLLGLVESFGLQAVQVHGESGPAFLEHLRLALPASVEIIRAFGIDEHFDWSVLNDYQDSCDMFLFDTKTGNYGGSGRTFDHGLLRRYSLDVPVMLAGGLGLEELAGLLERKDLAVSAVDLNSRLETAPGRKDLGLARRAIAMVRAAGEM